MRVQRLRRCSRAAGPIVLGLLLASDIVGTAAPIRVDLFDELFAQGRKQNAQLRTLTATFTETTTSSLLTRPLVARGTVAVERPSRVALRYSEPDERLVLIDGDRMTVEWPSRRVRQVRDIGASQRRIQKYFVDSSADELRGHFEVSAREADDRADAYVITMLPKRRQIREGLSRLELWVDRDRLLLAGMRMTFPNGDTKLMTFANIHPNAPLEPGTFDSGRSPGN